MYGNGDRIETTCVVTDGDGNRFGQERSGTDSEFPETDGMGINVHPHAALYLVHHTTKWQTCDYCRELQRRQH